MTERVPLSFLLVQHKDEQPPVQPVVPFAALYGEEPKIVTAVLERTGVLASATDQYDRITVRHEFILVDPATVEWRTKTSDYDGGRVDPSQAGKPSQKLRNRETERPKRSTRWAASPLAPRPADGAAVREKSDERARQNQADVEAAKQRELAVLRAKETTPMPDVMKHCPGCKLDKPKSEFPPGKVLIGNLRRHISELRDENARLKADLDGVNAQLAELLEPAT